MIWFNANKILLGLKSQNFDPKKTFSSTVYKNKIIGIRHCCASKDIFQESNV